jgi:membrane protease YdiL (CAAX protease family)
MDDRTLAARIFITHGTTILRSGWRIGIFFAVLIFFGLLAELLVHQFLPGSITGENIGLCIALILASVITTSFLDHRPFYAFGIAIRRRFFIELGQGMLVSGVMMTFIVIVFMLTGSIEIDSLGISGRETVWFLLRGLAYFTIAGFLEELLFRGYIFQTFARGTSRMVAIAVVSVLFGAIHLRNPSISVFSFLNIILAGIFLSLAYFKTETLWFCTALHIGWNYFQGCIYSMPVSGLTPPGLSIFHATLTGPAWLTGGSFGPEGGVCSTVILLAGTAFIWYSPWIRNENPPAEPVPAPASDTGAANT